LTTVLTVAKHKLMEIYFMMEIEELEKLLKEQENGKVFRELR
jgi:hypothetical protein